MFIRVSNKNGRWRADRVEHSRILNQLRKEAGLHLEPYPDPPDAYDRLLSAAGRHNFGLETVSDE